MGLVGLLSHLSLRHLNRGVAGRISNLDLEQRSVAATHQARHEADAAAGVQVHVSNVSRADELVVHEHPGTLGLGCLFGKLSLGHHGLGVAGAVSDFDHEGRCVLATYKAGHQADAAAGFQVHVRDVSCADELVVHEHPGTLGLVGLLGDFVLGHLDRGVARCICNLNFKQFFVLHGSSPLDV